MQVLAGMRVSSDVCFHEFINRGVSLKVNQLWAIKLSTRKLRELRSMADERCIKDVWWEWKRQKARDFKVAAKFHKVCQAELTTQHALASQAGVEGHNNYLHD